MKEELKIRTGYFAKAQTYINAGYMPVSIARKNPITLPLGITETYFAPSDALWKKDKEKNLSKEEYTELYEKEMDISVVREIIDSIENIAKLHNYKGIVMLCYEKNPEECHRSVLAKYLERNLHIQALEFDVERDFIQASQETKENIDEPEQ